jgi:hypothetical protein
MDVERVHGRRRRRLNQFVGTPHTMSAPLLIPFTKANKCLNRHHLFLYSPQRTRLQLPHVYKFPPSPRFIAKMGFTT